MSDMCEKVSFRKTFVNEEKQDNAAKSRKAIDARMSTPLKDNHLERNPYMDRFSK